MRDIFRHFCNDDPVDITYRVDLYEDSSPSYIDWHHVTFEYKGIDVSYPWYGERSLVEKIVSDICKAIDIEGKQGFENYKNAVEFMRKMYTCNVYRSESTQQQKEYVLVEGKIYNIEAVRYCLQGNPYEFFEIKIKLENGKIIRVRDGQQPQYDKSIPPKRKRYEECLQQVRKEIIFEYEENHVLPSKECINESFSNKYNSYKQWLENVHISINNRQLERDYI